MASSSPSSPFHTHRIFQGQGGSHRSAFSRPVCYQGHTAVSIGKPNYRCDKWEKSSPCCPRRSGKEGGCTSFTAKAGHSLAKMEESITSSQNQLLLPAFAASATSGSCSRLQQFSAKAEMMKCSQGWISRSRFGWWEHTQLMPTSRFDDRLL